VGRVAATAGALFIVVDATIFGMSLHAQASGQRGPKLNVLWPSRPRFAPSSEVHFASVWHGRFGTSDSQQFNAFRAGPLRLKRRLT
jgi:hypothetical protein